MFFVDGVTVSEAGMKGGEGPESVPVINFSAVDTNVMYGDNAFLNWTISNASSCLPSEGTGDWGQINICLLYTSAMSPGKREPPIPQKTILEQLL